MHKMQSVKGSTRFAKRFAQPRRLNIYESDKTFYSTLWFCILKSLKSLQNVLKSPQITPEVPKSVHLGHIFLLGLAKTVFLRCPVIHISTRRCASLVPRPPFPSYSSSKWANRLKMGHVHKNKRGHKLRQSANFCPIALKQIEHGLNTSKPAFYLFQSDQTKIRVSLILWHRNLAEQNRNKGLLQPGVTWS